MSGPGPLFAHFAILRVAHFAFHKIAKPVSRHTVGTADTPQSPCGVRWDVGDRVEQVVHLDVGVGVRAPQPPNDFGHSPNIAISTKNARARSVLLLDVALRRMVRRFRAVPTAPAQATGESELGVTNGLAQRGARNHLMVAKNVKNSARGRLVCRSHGVCARQTWHTDPPVSPAVCEECPYACGVELRAHLRTTCRERHVYLGTRRATTRISATKRSLAPTFGTNAVRVVVQRRAKRHRERWSVR